MRKLMYIAFFLILAANLLAQESYVIDSVCVGAQRTYRIDGEEGDTYEWNINRLPDSTPFASDIAYIDFMDLDRPAAGDTTWGSEIDQLWDEIGEYYIVVRHWSVHGCDTVQMGNVKVFPLPVAEAGPDLVICSLDDIVVDNDTAWNYSSFYWASTGDGSFSSEYELHPTYYLGANDSLTGSITLVLTAFGLADNETCIPAVDSVTFEFSKPDISFSVKELLCYNDRDAVIRANIIGGAPPFDFEWTGPDGYTSNDPDSITGLGAGIYTLKVTDANTCYDIDSVEIVNPPELLIDDITLTAISCYGYSDGAITASASGGTGNLTYQWRSALGSTYSGNEITGLPADTYFLVVYDENLCTVRDTIVLEEPEELLVNVTADDTILCQGDELTLHGNPVGGTGELDHRWTGSGSIYLEYRYDSVAVFKSNAPVGTHRLVYIIRDEADCEATDSIDLIVYPPTYSYDSMEICAGAEPFLWNNRTISSDADRTYLDTLFGMNQYGCDSLLTLDVKVLFPELYDTTIYVCENEEPFAPYGNIVIAPDRDSIYLDTLYYTDSGCDSLLITINVFTLPVTDTLLEMVFCSGADEFQLNKRWIQTDSSQVYLDTLVNSFGCDSLLTYDVTIIPPDTTYVFDTLCQDAEPYVWNNITILTQYDSIYQATLPNQYGCDSIVNLDVHLLPVTDTLIDTLLCYGTPEYAWNNLVIYAEHDSIYLDTLVNQWGCDSLLTLNVTIKYPDIVDIDTTLCEGVPVFAWGVNTPYMIDSYVDSVYTDTLQNQFGCDSIVNLDVQILRPDYILDTIVVCENEPAFTWHSLNILTGRDSIYTDTLYYEAGCDSLRLRLELISNPVTDTLLETILCEGSEEFAWNNVWIQTDSSQLYLDTLYGANQFGCDSLLSYDVTIVPAIKDTLADVFCFGEPVNDWFGISISNEKDSTYIYNKPGLGGCDTLFYYEVTINPVTDTILDITLCYGLDDFMWNNRLISGTVSDFYLDTLDNRFGCDSLLTYNVTILPPDTTLVYDTLCLNELVADWNGLPIQTRTDSIYEANVPNSDGCDSIVLLYTTILEGGVSHDTVFACTDYTWTDGTGNTYTSSGDYYYTVGGNVACADTVWLHLRISPPMILNADPVDVLCYGDSSGSVVLSVSGGIEPYRYLWDTGETTQNLAGLAAGTYTVTVYDSLDCEASRSIVIAQPDSIVLVLDKITDVEVYGQSTGSIEVTVGGGTPGPGYTFEWIDELGNVVGTGEDLFDQPAGIYTLLVKDDNQCQNSGTYEIIEPELNPCLEDTTLICFEDLSNYPRVTTFVEYLALIQDAQAIQSVCGIDTTSFTSDSTVVNSSDFCYEEIRFYTLLDNCGDTIFSCEQHVVVNDVEKPTISCPDTIYVVNDVVPPAYADVTEFLGAGGSFDDNCGVIDVYQIGNDVSRGGTDPEIIERTYEAVDYCGNTQTCTQVIAVYLTAEFTIECEGLPDRTFECKAELPNYRTVDEFRAAGGYAYSYPFDIIDINHSDRSDGRTCPETITRTYTITNSNGDEVSCTQVYVVDDQTPPTLILPDKHIYCNGKWDYYNNYVDVLQYRNSHGNDAYDNCGNNNIAYVSLWSETKTGTCPTKYERLYRIGDRCGNVSEAIEIIYKHDTVPPVIVNFEPEITSDCDLPPVYTDAGLFATDDCGIPQITLLGVYSGGAGEPGVFYRRYRISDGCNDVDTLQRIVIRTIYTPEFDALEPVCQFGDAPELPDTSLNGITGSWTPAVISTSLPGTFTFTFIPDSGQCAGPVNLTAEVLPAIAVTEQHVDQGYNPNPVGVIDIDINGGSGVYDILWTGPNGFTDSVAYISSLYAGEYRVEISDNIGCYDSITVTLLALEPEFSCPPDTLIECPDISAYPALNGIAGFIAGGGHYYPLSIVDRIYSFEDTVSTAYCLSVERSYVVRDIYGRIDTCTQSIDFYDYVPPVIIAPDGDTAECLSAVMPNINNLADFIALGGQAYDPNCEIDPGSFTVRDTAIIQGTGLSQVIFYYSIADICGNVARDTSYYLITDDQAPEVYCADITVYLDENGYYRLTVQDSIAMIDSLYDNCTAPEDLKVYIDRIELSCAEIESGSQVRVMVVDEAGLSGECWAQVSVRDTVPPVAICRDIDVYLDENGQVGITPDMINNGSFDNCQLERVEISKDNFDCTEVGDNRVVLTVYDIYGNSDTCEATVTVHDVIPPYIECVGAFTVQLDSTGTFALNWRMLTDSVSDNCAIDSVYLDKYLLDCDHIPNTSVLVTAFDVNGNWSDCTVDITVLGNIEPVAENDTAITAVNVAVDINVLRNDYDLKTDIDYGTLGIVIEPSHGSVKVDTTTGIVTYTPDLNYEGTDIFRYEICDDAIPCEPLCDQALVFITVRPANQPPLALDDYYDVPCGDLFDNVMDNDSDPDGDVIKADPIPVTHPTNGTVTLYENGNFEYQPFVDFVGIDSFQYRIYDISSVPVTPLYDTAWVYITRVADNDCDGVADIDDIDDDNDGIRDVNEGYYGPDYPALDSDNDGIPDYYDIDSDNDGILDNIEGQDEDNYIDPEGWRDENGNGWDDRYDHEEGGYPFDIALTDTDGDGVPDYLDIDSDNDGVFDYIEGSDDNADGIADITRIYSDTDFDGLDDAYDTHPGWGLTDNETGSAAPLQDFDGDGVRDWRDTNDEDDEHMTNMEDLNGNGDFSDDDLDLDGHPEYLDVEMDCELFIPDGFSPNDDGVHDFFQILCIYPRYPNAKMMIFNRQGQKLFEKENYGNYDVWGWDDAWWWGTTENRFTIGQSGGLPAGNYVYVLELGTGEVRNGTVMLAY